MEPVKINIKKDYGLVGILVILALYVITFVSNYMRIIFGEVSTKATSEFILNLLFGPYPLIFFIFTVIAIYLVLFKNKFFWLPLILMFLNKIAILFRYDLGGRYGWSFLVLESSRALQTIIFPAVLFTLLIVYVISKRLGYDNRIMESIGALISALYIIFIWLF